MLTRFILPIFIFFSILAQAALSRADVFSAENGDQHFIQILQGDPILLNGRIQNVYQIRMCETHRREVCGILGSRAYSVTEIERARAALVKQGWLGIGAETALVLAGAMVGIWAAPAAYLAAEVYLNPSTRFTAAEVLSIKAIRGEHVKVSAKISDMGFLIDKTFRSLDSTEFALPERTDLRSH